MTRPSAIEALVPHRHYYGTLRGRWAAPFEFDITNWGEFWAAPMGWLDRWRVLSLVWTTFVIGRARIDTVVDYRADAGEVHHQLRIRKWGLRVYLSREVIALHPDGRGLTIRGVEHKPPLWWRPSPLQAVEGRIAEDGRSAQYELSFMGGPLRIRTNMVDGGADIRFDAGWGGGVQRLRAHSPGPST